MKFARTHSGVAAFWNGGRYHHAGGVSVTLGRPFWVIRLNVWDHSGGYRLAAWQWPLRFRHKRSVTWTGG